MSTHKSSTTTGAPATKITDWTKVPDEELATNIDDTDSVGDAKAWEKCRRLCVARDKEIRRAEKARREAEEREWKRQVEEAEKRRKEEEERRQREAEAEQKRKDEERKCATAAEARKRQHADSEAQASGSRTNASICIRSCAKAKERCEWPEVEMTASRAGMSPRGGEHKKRAKKAADDNDNDEIVVLSGRKPKQQGGSETLKEISD
ncbi:hypothetical protein ID866_12479 [Astraeus odoratus]|nr:hypothetical protein ID866_12479 [Astraeus odoratus]